jgi:nucleotide-binding universal stress UspA family protein
MDQKRGRIVVGVDGSAGSKAALAWAAAQAKLSGATLDAIAAWSYPASYGWAPVYPDNDSLSTLTQKALSKTLKATLGEAAAAEITTTVTEGQPAEVLVAASADAELLVVGSRGRGGFASLVLGSVSQHCVQHAPCPVAVIPPADEGK